MNTPDTEWEKWCDTLAGYSGSASNENFKAHKEATLALLSTRDTYWKERVRKEVEGIRKKGNNGEGLPFENSPEIYGNARMEAWKNGHNQALDTLLDNLK